jgi:hypothetical protein
MGLFTQRPQEPSAWAALPGEPLRPRSPADRLEDASPVLDGLGLVTGGVESISIPVEPILEQAVEQAGEHADEAGA